MLVVQPNEMKADLTTVESEPYKLASGLTPPTKQVAKRFRKPPFKPSDMRVQFENLRALIDGQPRVLSMNIIEIDHEEEILVDADNEWEQGVRPAAPSSSSTDGQYLSQNKLVLKKKPSMAPGSSMTGVPMSPAVGNQPRDAGTPQTTSGFSARPASTAAAAPMQFGSAIQQLPNLLSSGTPLGTIGMVASPAQSPVRSVSRTGASASPAIAAGGTGPTASFARSPQLPHSAHTIAPSASFPAASTSSTPSQMQGHAPSPNLFVPSTTTPVAASPSPAAAAGTAGDFGVAPMASSLPSPSSTAAAAVAAGALPSPMSVTPIPAVSAGNAVAWKQNRVFPACLFCFLATSSRVEEAKKAQQRAALQSELAQLEIQIEAAKVSADKLINPMQKKHMLLKMDGLVQQRDKKAAELQALQ